MRKMILTGLLLVLATSASFASELSRREQAAQQVTQQLLKQLGGQLKQAMQAGGPANAINICREAAPKTSEKLSLENGWRVTRVSTKPRNALLGTPDSWERKTLADFVSRAEKGESYQSMKQSEIVDEGGEKYFRYMKPLVIKPLCLSCHGNEKQIPATVRDELKQYYPFDRAENYRIGELRGAVSIKQPLRVPLRKKF